MRWPNGWPRPAAMRTPTRCKPGWRAVRPRPRPRSRPHPAAALRPPRPHHAARAAPCPVGTAPWCWYCLRPPLDAPARPPARSNPVPIHPNPFPSPHGPPSPPSPTPPHPPRPMAPPAPPAPGPASRPMWGWALAGACAGVLPDLLVFAPAHWLADSVPHASDGQLVLLEPRGPGWNGSAHLVLAGGSASQDRAALPGTVTWQLRPRFNSLRARVHARCCTPAPLEARGVAGGMQLSGQARLDALAMSTRLSTLRPMGSYRLVLQGGEVPAVTLSTLDGALQLSGSRPSVGPPPPLPRQATTTRPPPRRPRPRGGPAHPLEQQRGARRRTLHHHRGLNL